MGNDPEVWITGCVEATPALTDESRSMRMNEANSHRHCSRILFLLVLSHASCADDPPPPAATPASMASPAKLAQLPRSSIAAVVQHRAELGLSDDEVRDLELRDQERESEDAAIRDEVERRRKQAQEAKPASASGAGTGAGSPASGRSGRMGGGGMRSGGMGGGMRGGGMGGRAPRGSGAGSTNETHQEASVQDRMDANDTKAYLDAEDLLKAEQRERAREIASEFREKLYERREQLRAQAAAAK